MILSILVLLAIVVLLILNIAKVAVDQRAVNFIILSLLLLLALQQSPWVHSLHF